MATPLELAQDFLSISSQFKLGHLQTESFHPVTAKLSQTLIKKTGEGISLLKEVDTRALNLIKDKADEVHLMSLKIHETLTLGGRVFFCGCGATGRLSLVVETLYRQSFTGKNNVFAFMAGGDFALIKSVESFEDQTSYGERQLMELGFKEGDLLIATTEGGETPFVIGAALKAAEVSSMGSYFLYCNPDELLSGLERCRLVLSNPKVAKINLSVGPMGISGSTRMQASTVLMMAAGAALLHHNMDQVKFSQYWSDSLHELNQLDYKWLAPFVEAEAELYKSKKFLNYTSDHILGISILTDTTERSPTFSLSGFENLIGDISRPSLSYLFLPAAKTSKDAWFALLHRAPRALDWAEFNGRINIDQVYGFDISTEGRLGREKRLETKTFEITHHHSYVLFKLEGLEYKLPVGGDILLTHLKVKILINTLSTSIMGLLGRYEGNVMTWVRASNNKLVDRAARYIAEILSQQGLSRTYEQIVQEIFKQLEGIHENEPIVLKVVEALKLSR